MVNNTKRKSEKVNEELVAKALKAIKNGQAVRSAANLFGLSRGLLRSRLKTKRTIPYESMRVFTIEQENALKKYLLRAVAMYQGLSYYAVRELAYGYAIKLKTANVIAKIPKHWMGPKIASRDWLKGFKRRHPELVLRKPSGTSLDRATAFNRHNINACFTNLRDVISRFGIESHNIWNMDETGLTTVQQPAHVIAQRGARTVGGITSGERGVLVTLALACSSGGQSCPPFYIFPRKKFQSHFLTGASGGADGSANSSGWMNSADFLKFLKHFVKHARPTIENKCLLLLDNHESHLSIERLDYCTEHGIIVLSFPPHTTHKLQPLDRAVFGPIKHYFNSACDTWMRLSENAAKPITIYDIPKIAAKPIDQGATPANIKSGFAVAGIWPLDPSLFTDSDFLCSDITDRTDADPLPLSPDVPDIERAAPAVNAEAELSSVSTMSIINSNVASTCLNLDQTLEDVRPFFKAAPRKGTKRGRKRQKTAILTDPEIREALRKEQQAVADKKTHQINAKAARAKKKVEREKAKVEKMALKLLKQQEKATKKAAAEKAKAEKATAKVCGRIRPKKSRQVHASSTSDDDALECCVCNEEMPNSARHRKCAGQSCGNRAHRECVGNIVIFKCRNFDSDSDGDEEGAETESHDDSIDQQ